MADTKISALTAVPSASAADIFAVVQGGVTKSETLAQLMQALSATSLTVTYAIPVSASATALNSSSLSAVTCSLTYLTTLSITAATVLGTVVATGGASGTYSSGDLVISNGIVTTIP